MSFANYARPIQYYCQILDLLYLDQKGRKVFPVKSDFFFTKVIFPIIGNLAINYYC